MLSYYPLLHYLLPHYLLPYYPLLHYLLHESRRDQSHCDIPNVTRFSSLDTPGAIDHTMISLVRCADGEAVGFGCRGIARLALDGRRKKMLEKGGTEAALAVVRRQVSLSHPTPAPSHRIPSPPHPQVTVCHFTPPPGC